MYTYEVFARARRRGAGDFAGERCAPPTAARSGARTDVWEGQRAQPAQPASTLVVGSARVQELCGGGDTLL